MVVLWDSLGTLLDVRSVQARATRGGWSKSSITVPLKAWKPAQSPYLHALRRAGLEAAEACLVAAQDWDVQAAGRYGLRAVWVDRLEGRWLLPGDPPEQRASNLLDAARLASSS